MATKTIIQLDAATTPALTDWVEIWQGSGPSKRAQMSSYRDLILGAFSCTATGLTYANGVLSLTSGYVIPTQATLNTFIAQNGNAFGTGFVIGTTDNNGVNIMVNSTIKFSVAANGDVIANVLAGGGTQMVVADNTGKLGVQAIPVASGIQSLNGLTASTQIFATPGTSGTSPNWVSSGSTHTLNIPIASGTNTGLVNTGSQTFAGAKFFSTSVQATLIAISGTAGNGYLLLTAQSATPTTPITGVNIFSDATARLGFTSIAGNTVIIDPLSITANRTYTLPDVSTTLVGGTGANTRVAFWNSANTLSSDSGLTYDSSVLSFNTAGGTISIKTGSNAKAGSATLSAGTVIILNSSVTANSKIFVTVKQLGTVAAPKAMLVTRSAGTSFTITSSDNTDTSVVDWIIVESN